MFSCLLHSVFCHFSSPFLHLLLQLTFYSRCASVELSNIFFCTPCFIFFPHRFYRLLHPLLYRLLNACCTLFHPRCTPTLSSIPCFILFSHPLFHRLFHTLLHILFHRIITPCCTPLHPLSHPIYPRLKPWSSTLQWRPENSQHKMWEGYDMPGDRQGSFHATTEHYWWSQN